ncbi:hypothetical protein [Weissella bombi]|uniref:Uncharacterized protein n=2 Tax=Weissella bombi TaxID=1505725 RepID=A0A1C4C1I6_9LACO|nr:hypothetical protein [Weissella bombi]SCC12864.1 hypothetical protein GA0061074_11919 [Weissella bombi]
MADEVTIQLPPEMLTQLSEAVIKQVITVAEQNVMQRDEFVQLNRTAKTPKGKRTLEDYLGGISLDDFKKYWRRRVESEPGLTIPKGESQLLYHGRKVQEYIAEHAAEAMNKRR